MPEPTVPTPQPQTTPTPPQAPKSAVTPVTAPSTPLKQPEAKGEKGPVTKSLQNIKKPIEIPILKKLQIYLVPIVAIFVFLAILVILVIPGVSDIFSKLDQATLVGEQLDNVNQSITQLTTLRAGQSQLNTNLQYVNQIAPAGKTEVVKFQQRISELAGKSGLQVIKSETDEEELVLPNEVKTLGIIQIPSTFTLAGKLANIKDFIQKIKLLEDFVIVGEMQIKVAQKVDVQTLAANSNLTWSLIITLIKYQFQQPDEQNHLAQAYAEVPPSVKIDTDVLEFIRSKYGADITLPQQ